MFTQKPFSTFNQPQSKTQKEHKITPVSSPRNLTPVSSFRRQLPQRMQAPTLADPGGRRTMDHGNRDICHTFCTLLREPTQGQTRAASVSAFWPVHRRTQATETETSRQAGQGPARAHCVGLTDAEYLVILKALKIRLKWVILSARWVGLSPLAQRQRGDVQRVVAPERGGQRGAPARHASDGRHVLWASRLRAAGASQPMHSSRAQCRCSGIGPKSPCSRQIAACPRQRPQFEPERPPPSAGHTLGGHPATENR